MTEPLHGHPGKSGEYDVRAALRDLHASRRFWRRMILAAYFFAAATAALLLYLLFSHGGPR